MTIEQRFWAKVDRVGPNACWLWKGRRNQDGYGRFDVYRGKTVVAHRLAYEFSIGPIPDGLSLDHLCRTPACVNPSHMDAVTHRVNVLRGNGACAAHARKTHCKYGHEFTPENTAFRKDIPTSRVCLICKERRRVERRRG